MGGEGDDEASDVGVKVIGVIVEEGDLPGASDEVAVGEYVRVAELESGAPLVWETVLVGEGVCVPVWVEVGVGVSEGTYPPVYV